MIRVLVVDDDPVILEGFALYLEDEGFQVLRASSGEQALEIFRQEDPEVVICDLFLPGLSGLGVLEALRPWGVPFIVVSGNQDIRRALEAQSLGAWDYLVKPLEDLAQIKTSIQRVLERRDLLAQQAEYQAKLERTVAQRTAELSTKVQELETSQDQLSRALAAKEGLLAEVHHRVKNNLQWIISLLDLQRSLTGPTLEAWDQITRRIHSMARIHETLTDQQAGAQVDAQNLLRDLLEEGLLNRGLDPRKVQMTGDPWIFDISDAFALGLLVAEVGQAWAQDSEASGGTLDLEHRTGGPGLWVEFRSSGDFFQRWPREGDAAAQLLPLLVKQLKGSWFREASRLRVILKKGFDAKP